METKQRVEWIDIYKALAIILVVLGHATPLFNKYIYQFHVGAFFFISGYVSGIKNKRFDDIFINKIFTLFIPYTFFASVGVFLFWIMDKIGILHYISTASELPGLRELFATIYRGLRCDWLGASWFILALLGSVIIQKMFLLMNGNKVGIIYIIMTLGCFLGAYYWHSMGKCPIPVWNFTLFSIAQFYFGVGVIANYLKEVWIAYGKKKILNSMAWSICFFILNIAVFYYFGDIRRINMDISSLAINNPVIDLVMVLNGIVFIWNMSQIFVRIRMERLKKVIGYIGKNTMGILVFQFLGYKIVTAVLCIIQIAPIEALHLLCPPAEFSNWLWPVYLSVSILFSLGIWSIMKKSRLLCFFSGNSRNQYKKIYLRLTEIKPYEQICAMTEGGAIVLYDSYKDILYAWKNDKIGIIMAGTLVIFGIIYIII